MTVTRLTHVNCSDMNSSSIYSNYVNNSSPEVTLIQLLKMHVAFINLFNCIFCNMRHNLSDRHMYNMSVGQHRQAAVCMEKWLHASVTTRCFIWLLKKIMREYSMLMLQRLFYVIAYHPWSWTYNVRSKLGQTCRSVRATQLQRRNVPSLLVFIP